MEHCSRATSLAAKCGVNGLLGILFVYSRIDALRSKSVLEGLNAVTDFVFGLLELCFGNLIVFLGLFQLEF